MSYNNDYYLKHKQEISLQRKEYHKNHPWAKSLWDAKQRCENPNNSDYRHWGERGIEFHLTNEDGEYLWNRDKAWLMKKPSLDRENNDKNYTVENCRFIELAINSNKEKLKPVLQFDLQGNFIKEYTSISETSRNLNLKISNISKVCNKIKGCKTTGNFIFKFKE
jgi:hypothetical protein